MKGTTGKPYSTREKRAKPGGEPRQVREPNAKGKSAPTYGKPTGTKVQRTADERRPAGERRPAEGGPSHSRPMAPRSSGSPSPGNRPAPVRPGGKPPIGKFAKRTATAPLETTEFSAGPRRPAKGSPSHSRPMAPRSSGSPSPGNRPAPVRPGGKPPIGKFAKRTATAPLETTEFSAGPRRPAKGGPGHSRPMALRSSGSPSLGNRPAPVRPGGKPPIGKFAKRPAAFPSEATGLSIGARRTALEVLRDVHQNGAFAQLSLNESLLKSPLKPVDKRLVTSIVYGTLENEIRIDYALDRFMERPTREPLQRDILRLSACQILFHDRVPDSAAVNEGVNLAKGMGMESAAGFINAVLRNLSRGKDEIPWPKREEDLRRYLHIMGSMPEWIVDKLLEAYGEAEAEQIIMYRQAEHPIVVRPNLLKITDGEFRTLLEKKAWQSKPGVAPHAYLVTGAAEVAMDNDYRNGLFSIQGQSSMLAAEAVQAKPGMRVLDACAAPGGKSAYLCEAMQNTGRVFAWELHEKRAMLLESLKRRLNLDSLRISVRDATEPKPDMNGTLDAVLLDAPCSGLGVMVQKPDLKYRLQPEDMEPIVRQQRELLNALCGYVKPNGVLVYSTCSILPEENTKQIEAFLGEHPEFSAEPLPDSFPESLRRQQTALGLQLLGCRDDVEGFYIVRMRRARA